MNRLAIGMAALALVAASDADALQLTSPTVANGASLATDQVKDNCGGKNISPALSWSGAPVAAKSFAVTMYDPDAHGGWWHWFVINIPAAAQGMPAGAGNGSGLPEGTVQLKNDFGDAAYGGACPPPGSGPHRYVVSVWAMPIDTLPFGADAKPATAETYLKAHALARAEITAAYQR